ncbi:2-C-methyl-D-erythritol 2,4-cyclodiphosphate synthase [Desulfurobacterium atlanticum]|uniref:2-C-methyl-D-erythritol 2,4-cyclodiphosphate synthase n=1 Tax=Desulfurobacterium atlanticum TaxID=240169 RepID=A0A238XUE5_9BACT|nr:2-C-methyl-D-erythritol 2,4-cyclodiphosphate synthase [Desulfurobacterium atlanticum]SNR62158.1 2-C-methyl-D-erythritol 2,4-cyclodiphosphate synthase [Desulfurobacterium atlanticum]
MFRVGIGFDVHRFVEGRPLKIGGVEIPFEKGLLGHSDADVLLHAISDAILGAVALGDIGKHFPDSDEKYKGANSLVLLGAVYRLLKEKGFKIINVDCVVIAQKPKLAPYIDEMRKNISVVLETSFENVSVKATTTERLGFTGREEGIAAQAVVMVQEVNSGI